MKSVAKRLCIGYTQLTLFFYADFQNKTVRACFDDSLYAYTTDTHTLQID